MEVKAIHRYARSSAQRTRLVADQVRGLPVQKALDLLQFSPRKAAALIRKVLLSAIANAENNRQVRIVAVNQSSNCFIFIVFCSFQADLLNFIYSSFSRVNVDEGAVTGNAFT